MASQITVSLFTFTWRLSLHIAPCYLVLLYISIFDPVYFLPLSTWNTKSLRTETLFLLRQKQSLVSSIFHAFVINFWRSKGRSPGSRTERDNYSVRTMEEAVFAFQCYLQFHGLGQLNSCLIDFESWMATKSTYVKGLILRIAVLRGSGIFKAWGLVGGL
jgi:hypothetical protein